MFESEPTAKMFAKGLMWLIVTFCILDLGLGQEIVEISGSKEEDTPVVEEEKNQPFQVEVEESGRHMRYDIPDDGLLPKWCTSEGKVCPAATGDIKSFDNVKHELECMHKCREFSCMSAQHHGSNCVLSSAQCSPQELVDGDGKYYNRLPASQTSVQPGCPVGTNPVGLDEEWPLNRYCKGVGVECPGVDLIKFWFRPTARQCLVECNLHPACMTAHYRDKICYLRANRCTKDQLIARPGGFDFHRLKRDEECPDTRPIYEEENTPWTASFCMAWGKTCKGYDIYLKPQRIFPFQKCLQKCAKIKSCGSVDFFNNRCAPKEHRCTDEELETDMTVQNFMRLQEGEECPGNRRPPSQEAPWSDRFCLKRDWDCPGGDMEAAPVPVDDFIGCLKKCIEATDCETAQLSNGQCMIKSKTCSENERQQKLSTDMYYRLREGDECTEGSTPPECPPNSSYQTEHSTCPVTCDNQMPDLCDIVFEPSCVCDDGYAQNEAGECVDLSECGCREHDGTKRELGASWTSADCEVLYACELNEESRPEITETEQKCPELEECDGSGKCVCVTGYEKKEGSDTCEPVLECGPHSSFEPEGLPCYDTCAEPNLEADCTSPAEPVCHCNEGYIQKEAGGECVPLKECGCKAESGEIITVDTTWLASDCSKTLTCSERMDELPQITEQNHTCPENSACQPLPAMPMASCVCNAGWSHHVDGTCVPGIECEPPTEFVGQLSSCPSTCRQPKLNETCTSTSGAGCACPAGMLLDDDEDCIPAEACPCYDENGRPKNVDDVWMTNDCSAYNKCEGTEAGKAPEISSEKNECQEHAVCDMSSGFPQCVCDEGYTLADDGVACVPEKEPCDEALESKVNTFVEDVMSIVSGGCGSCSDTCRNPNGSKLCPAGSKLCKCFQEGYLFDETKAKCVPANECGCFDANGEHRLAGSTWVNNECSKQLTCTVTGEGPPEITEELIECYHCDGFGNCLDT